MALGRQHHKVEGTKQRQRGCMTAKTSLESWAFKGVGGAEGVWGGGDDDKGMKMSVQRKRRRAEAESEGCLPKCSTGNRKEGPTVSYKGHVRRSQGLHVLLLLGKQECMQKGARRHCQNVGKK